MVEALDPRASKGQIMYGELVGTIRTTRRALDLRTTFDISGRFSTGDVVLSWDGLQAYLAEVRRRLEHLRGRAFGAGRDYFIGIVVNVEDADAARAIWAEQVEPVLFGASHGWVPRQTYEPAIRPAVHRRVSEAILDLDRTDAVSVPGVLVQLPGSGVEGVGEGPRSAVR